MTWIAALAAHQRAGNACVLVTVVATKGSAPREAGVKMVVAADAQHGTIGGGALEHECVRVARTQMHAAAPALREFPLGPALGQCCGGHATVLFEPIAAVAWDIAVFGAGHVGQAVAQVLAPLPCRVRLIDPRAEAFPAALPDNAMRVHSSRPEQEVAALPDRAMVLVMTHDHALDYRIVAACLARELAFVGLIGSATKRARFVSRLRAEGVPVGRLTCPIGLAGAGGKAPAEIAISVAAQLLQLRDRAVSETSNVVPLHGCAGCESCA